MQIRAKEVRGGGGPSGLLAFFVGWLCGGIASCSAQQALSAALLRLHPRNGAGAIAQRHAMRSVPHPRRIASTLALHGTAWLPVFRVTYPLPSTLTPCSPPPPSLCSLH